MYEQLRARETEVLIIGGGNRKGAERLSARLKLPFPVLVDPDPDRAVYRRYGLDKVLIALQRSGTFLIDKQGIVALHSPGMSDHPETPVTTLRLPLARRSSDSSVSLLVPAGKEDARHQGMEQSKRVIRLNEWIRASPAFSPAFRASLLPPRRGT